MTESDFEDGNDNSYSVDGSRRARYNKKKRGRKANRKEKQ